MPALCRCSNLDGDRDNKLVLIVASIDAQVTCACSARRPPPCPSSLSSLWISLKSSGRLGAGEEAVNIYQSSPSSPNRSSCSAMHTPPGLHEAYTCQQRSFRLFPLLSVFLSQRFPINMPKGKKKQRATYRTTILSKTNPHRRFRCFCHDCIVEKGEEGGLKSRAAWYWHWYKERDRPDAHPYALWHYRKINECELTVDTGVSCPPSPMHLFSTPLPLPSPSLPLLFPSVSPSPSPSPVPFSVASSSGTGATHATSNANDDPPLFHNRSPTSRVTDACEADVHFKHIHICIYSYHRLFYLPSDAFE